MKVKILLAKLLFVIVAILSTPVFIALYIIYFLFRKEITAIDELSKTIN